MAIEPSIWLSLIAVAISSIALWKSHLEPFDLRISNSVPRFSLYSISKTDEGTFQGIIEDGRTWWIPSIDISISMQNLGQRAGKVEKIRFRGENTESGNEEIFEPKWIVDFSKFDPIRTDRFAWVNEAVIREWYPILLAGREEKSMDIVFEPLEPNRWHEKRRGDLMLTLEVKSDSDTKWKTVDESRIPLSNRLYEEETSISPTRPSRELSSDVYESTITDSEG